MQDPLKPDVDRHCRHQPDIPRNGVFRYRLDGIFDLTGNTQFGSDLLHLGGIAVSYEQGSVRKPALEPFRSDSSKAARTEYPDLAR
jgi:hypothetical protein